MNKFSVGIILACVSIVVLFWVHGAFISECMNSGNTRAYCEFLFWR
jgi:hypothetical protein